MIYKSIHEMEAAMREKRIQNLTSRVEAMQAELENPLYSVAVKDGLRWELNRMKAQLCRMKSQHDQKLHFESGRTTAVQGAFEREI